MRNPSRPHRSIRSNDARIGHASCCDVPLSISVPSIGRADVAKRRRDARSCCGAAKSRVALRTIRQTASVGLMRVRPNRRARNGAAASMPPVSMQRDHHTPGRGWVQLSWSTARTPDACRVHRDGRLVGMSRRVTLLWPAIPCVGICWCRHYFMGLTCRRSCGSVSSFARD